MDSAAADADARHGGHVKERYVVTAILAASVASPARADGPHIAFHATQGCCTVTVFSAPDPLVAGPVELNILVQRASDGSLLPLASVTGRLALRGHAAIPFTAVPGSVSNPQLPGATVRLPIPGDYALDLQVREKTGESAHFAGTLPVAANEGTRNTVLWSVFLPVLLALLFLANQQGKFRMRCPRTR